MYKQHGQFHFFPSDLTRHMESPFASWMDRFSIEHPDQAPEKDPADALILEKGEVLRGRREKPLFCIWTGTVAV